MIEVIYFKVWWNIFDQHHHHHRVSYSLQTLTAIIYTTLHRFCSILLIKRISSTREPFRIKCHKKFHYRRTISQIRSLSVVVLRYISSFVIVSVHDVFSILHRNQTTLSYKCLLWYSHHAFIITWSFDEHHFHPQIASFVSFT